MGESLKSMNEKLTVFRRKKRNIVERNIRKEKVEAFRKKILCR